MSFGKRSSIPTRVPRVASPTGNDFHEEAQSENENTPYRLVKLAGALVVLTLAMVFFLQQLLFFVGAMPLIAQVLDSSSSKLAEVSQTLPHPSGMRENHNLSVEDRRNVPLPVQMRNGERLMISATVSEERPVRAGETIGGMPVPASRLGVLARFPLARMDDYMRDPVRLCQNFDASEMMGHYSQYYYNRNLAIKQERADNGLAAADKEEALWVRTDQALLQRVRAVAQEGWMGGISSRWMGPAELRRAIADVRPQQNRCANVTRVTEPTLLPQVHPNMSR